jgi:thioredoxin-related protein
MSKNFISYAVVIAVLGLVGWRVYSNRLDLASLAQMPARNSSPAYDGEARIAEAFKAARQTGKLVLMQSTSEGCTWCHVLHKMLTTDQKIVAKIASDYVYVLVDTTNDQNRDFYKKYADNTDHTLVLIVMNVDGKQLAKKVGDEFVEGDAQHYHISPDTMLKFLENAALKK